MTAIGVAAMASGSSRANLQSIETSGKPPDSGGFLAFSAAGDGRGIPRRLAGHRGVALLNDALLRRLSGPGSGRIAQLVEQMTLNHRVPGSSPGAPTKLFKDLHKPEREQSGLVRPKMSAVAAQRLLRNYLPQSASYFTGQIRKRHNEEV
jgi:hypothetical protein